jgi:glutaredoxin
MKLTVLSRNYCHLCDDMIAALKIFQSRNQLQFDIAVVDVDLDAALESRYGDKVPVLLDGESEICHYFLDEARLAARLLNHA